MKKKLLFIALTACAFVGCQRTCVCKGYDGLIHNYTEEEIEQLHGGNCSNMVYQANTRYHSVCNWE